MSLSDRLKAQIAASGPISVAQYMNACLHDPQDGYYATRPALGAAGDFITAPLVSQMFGELIGLWALDLYVQMGRPARVLLVEIGPGDGTLMGDILRAVALDPAFTAAAEVWLVEVSPPLRAAQAARLGPAVNWAGSLAGIPQDAPLILVGNELLDCLPARQFERTADGWAERLVGLDSGGELAFGLRKLALPFAAPGGDAPLGAIAEQSPAQEALGADLGARIAGQGGAALLIDYGRDAPGFGDTLQALVRHQKVGVLEDPGHADLTVHADFPALAAAARAQGSAATPIIGQGAFLLRLGVETRAAALARSRPDRAPEIERQLERLIGDDQMGRLFKVLCLHHPDLVPAGFSEDP
jgi:SAM-dependent MidA family methyltransferase